MNRCSAFVIVSAAASPNSPDRTVRASNDRDRCNPSGTRGSRPSARARFRKCAVARRRPRTSPTRARSRNAASHARSALVVTVDTRGRDDRPHRSPTGSPRHATSAPVSSSSSHSRAELDRRPRVALAHPGPLPQPRRRRRRTISRTHTTDVTRLRQPGEHRLQGGPSPAAAPPTCRRAPTRAGRASSSTNSSTARRSRSTPEALDRTRSAAQTATRGPPHHELTTDGGRGGARSSYRTCVRVSSLRSGG